MTNQTNRKFNAFKLTPAINADYNLKQVLSVEKKLDDFKEYLHEGPIVTPKKEFTYKDKYFFGTLYRVRKDKIESVVNTENKKSKDIEVTEDEGIGYSTCFLYDHTINVVFIQSAAPGHGVTIKDFIKFIEIEYEIHGIEFSLVPNQNTLERYNNLQTITVFEIGISEPDPVVDSNENISHKAFEKIREESGASKIYVQLTGSKTKELNKSFFSEIVSRVINALTQQSNQALKETKLVCKGYDPELDTIQIIDFIKDRFLLSVNVEQDRYTSSLAIKLLRELEREYLEIQSELHKFYI